MAPKLSPGEQILFEGHPSWRAILDFYAKGLLVTLVVRPDRGRASPRSAVTSNPASSLRSPRIGVAVTLLAGFISRVTTSYTITNRRLHIQRGIVSREVQETRLERVQNVNYSQGLFQRILQIGDVDFDTAGGDDYGFIFSGVAEPEEVMEQCGRGDRQPAGNELGAPGAPAGAS